MPTPTLTSRTALVTDASRGIGKAIAIALAEAGAHIAVNYRERKNQAEATVAAVRQLGRKSAAFGADVSDAQAVWPGMRARGWGRIVNISSRAARGTGVVGVHDNASKAGMEGLTRGYAARLVSYGITVNAVAPSLIDTEMMASQRAENAAKVPLGRLGTSEEVAVAVVMVATNAYMTGQTVQVNGGRYFI